MNTLIIDNFLQYLYVKHTAGSKAPQSYVTAIVKTNDALARHGLFLKPSETIWDIRNENRLHDLYELIKKEQAKGATGIFKEESAKSYYRKHWCSAAINSFIEYIHSENAYMSISHYEQDAHKYTAAVVNLTENIIGKEKDRLVKIRANQYIFRKVVLDNYQHRCCITGLNIPSILRASHITPWAEDNSNRMNPQNGLCLSATFDAAFDRHLISLDEDLRLIFAPSLKEYYTNKSFRQIFKPYEGLPIELPIKYKPSQKFLRQHRAQLV